MMRLSFPNGEHSEVVVDQGQVRLGDVVSLGSLQMLVKPDSDSDIRRDVPRDPPAASAEAASSGAAARVVLRGVAGPLFGRSFPLTTPITLGRGADADVRLDDPALAERHARLEHHNDRVVLRDLGSSDGTVVNGVGVRDAVLHPGDQIALEHHRFVLEAPGLPPRGSSAFAPAARTGGGITQTMQAVGVAPGQADRGGARRPRGAVWGLIGAALLIMLLLAALLFYSPTLLP